MSWLLSTLLLVSVLFTASCDETLIEISDGTRIPGYPTLPSVVFLTNSPPAALPPEEAAAWSWLRNNENFNVQQVQMIDLPDAKLPQDAVLWWHYSSEETLPSVAVRPGNLEAIRNHLRAGGTALFSLIAAS